jgi:hypothetical protein
MQVTAFSTPERPEWRWRIVSYAGETVEESRETFATISAALERGSERMRQMNADDTTPPSRNWHTALRRDPR